jgi:L-amino acid N-acyltransferase YncA
MSAPPPTVNVTICACEEDHVAAITTIYAHHVLHGLASFEIEPPSENDMGQRRLDIVSRNYPYLVAECDREGLCCTDQQQGRNQRPASTFM